VGAGTDPRFGDKKFSKIAKLVAEDVGGRKDQQMPELPGPTDIYRQSCFKTGLELRTRRDSRGRRSHSLTIRRGAALRRFKINYEVRSALASAIEAIGKDPNSANKFVLSDESLSLTCEPPKFVLGDGKEPQYAFPAFRNLTRFYENLAKAVRIGD
jgi:hypothetical protein